MKLFYFLGLCHSMANIVKFYPISFKVKALLAHPMENLCPSTVQIEIPHSSALFVATDVLILHFNNKIKLLGNQTNGKFIPIHQIYTDIKILVSIICNEQHQFIIIIINYYHYFIVK